MKKILLLLVTLISSLTLAYAQCSNPYYRLNEGTRMETENYNDKGKLEGRQVMHVIKWEETGNGYQATIGYELFDKKDKPVTQGEYSFECIDGTIHMDMSAFLPEETIQAFKDMEMEIKMDKLEIPAVLKEGQTLDDGNMVITAKNGPMPMNFTFEMTDRKVEGKESVTTPVGTFDCFKLSSKTRSKMMISNSEFLTIQYMAEKYGAVKTETYRSNGKLMGYSLLTKFEE